MKPVLRYAILAAAIALAAGWWAKPGYIDLDLPVAGHKGGGAFWWESHHARLAYADAAGALYVHRRVGTAYPDTQGWKTTADVFAYFDPLLRQRGWEPAAAATTDAALPETRLLPATGLRTYYRPSHPGAESRVMMAVWPISGSVEGFNVVLTTANPSLAMRLSRAMD
jgi:hypothetical protein